MAVYVRFGGEDIELDYPLIDGALDLMALTCGNNLDQETIRRSEELKRMLAGKSKDESQGTKPRIKVTVPNKSRCGDSPKRKILKLDEPASTSGAKPGRSSRAFGIQSSTSRVEHGPSSRALDQPASISPVEPCPHQPASNSRTMPCPLSRAFGIQSSTSRVDHCPSSRALYQPASTSRARPSPSSRAFGIPSSTSQVDSGPSSRALDQSASTSRVEPCPHQPASNSRAMPGPLSRALGIQPSTSRVEPGSSSRALDQPASTSSARPGSSLPAGIQDLIGLCSMPIQKKITASDVSHGLCRLMLPKAPMEEVLEHIRLNRNEDIQRGIPVTVYGPDGREYAMNFKVWFEKYYVLNTRSWNQFCQDYLLRSKINMVTLTIQMFRHRQTDDLCFAITF